MGRLFRRKELKVKGNVRGSVGEDRAMVRGSVVLSPVKRLKSWGGWEGEIRVSG